MSVTYLTSYLVMISFVATIARAIIECDMFRYRVFVQWLATNKEISRKRESCLH